MPAEPDVTGDRQFDCSPTQFVGRVGALALALGVGAAILGLAGVATADTGGTDSATGSARDGAVRPGGAASGARSARADSDGNARTSGSAAPAETVQAPSAGGGAAQAQATGRRSVDVRAGAQRATPARDVQLPAAGAGDAGARAEARLSAPVADAGPATQVTAPQTATSAPIAAVSPVPQAPVAAVPTAATPVTDIDAAALLGGDGTGVPPAEALGWATLAVARRDDAVGSIEVAPAAAVTTGAPLNPAALLRPLAAAAELEAGCGPLTLCGQLAIAKPFIISALTLTLEDKIGAPEAVATSISTSAFDVINGLMLQQPTSQVAGYITSLANDGAFLGFVSGKIAAVPAVAALSPDVAATIGDAVGSLIQNSLGNTTVAQAVVPALQAFNLPTDLADAYAFIADAKKDPLAAILASGTGITRRELNPNEMQAAFVALLDDAPSQAVLGSAVTGAVDVLIGAATPLWAAPVNPDAIADFAGGLIATAVLGAGNAGIPALTATVGNALSGLFSSIGDDLGTQVGNAFVTLLQQSGVDAILATEAVDTIVTGLGGVAPFPIRDGLLQSLAPAAGVAVTSFVNSLFAQPGVTPALGTFVTQLIPGLLSDSGVQQKISGLVASAVSGLVGGGLGQAIGADVGNGLAALLANPTISGAAAGLIGTVVGGLLGAQGVVGALATAAGQLTTAQFDGTLSTVLPQVEADLRANPAIDAAVGPAVTAGVAQFLGNTSVWSAVDAAATSLVNGLVGDPAVQQALDAQVTAAVAGLLGGTPLGQTVGAQVGAAVVALVSNPAVSGALVGVADTLIGDFFRANGVVSALSGAAGQLATAAVVGNLDSVLPQVEAALKANSDIDSAVQGSVVAAVAEFLGDTSLWSAVDTAATTLVSGVLGDQQVQDALDATVTALVSTLIGGGDLGQAVGAQVGAAVVGLVTNPAVGGAVVGLVDTVSRDFFGTAGVIDALSGAAGDLALAVLTGEDLNAALAGIAAGLRVNPAIDTGVSASIGAAVTEFLDDTALWSAVDTTAVTLIDGLTGDQEVQQALDASVTAAVSALLGGGDLGDVVGAQVGAAVVALVANPAVSGALVDLVDTLSQDFFGATGVVDAFSGAASDLAVAVLTGESVTTALAEVGAALRANPAVDAGVQASVGGAVGQFLGDTALWSAVDGTLSTLVGELLGDSAVQQALGARVAAEVSTALGGGDFGAAVGAQLGAVVVGLVSSPIISGALVAIVDTAASDFLGSFGVVSAISGIASDFALALVTGVDPATALADAEAALTQSPAILSGVQTTIDDALGIINTQVLSNTAFQQGLGAAVTGLITNLAGNAAVQAYVGDNYGAAVEALLANTAVIGEVAGTLGSAVTAFLGYAGLSTALTDSLEVFVGGVLGGASVTDALQSALQSLQAAPAYVSAVNAVVPPALDTILGYADVRQAIGQLVKQEIAGAIGFGFVGELVGQVVDGTVDDLLKRKAGQELIDDVAVNVLLGMPTSDVTNYIVGEIVRKPSLQFAIGMSIGAGIGSIFGNNIIGDLIGLTAGIPAVAVVGVVSAVVGIYEWLVGLFTDIIGAAAVTETTGVSRYLEPVAVA